MFAEAHFRWEDLDKRISTRTQYVHTWCNCLCMTYLYVIHRHILVLESHLDIPCACILAMRAIQVSKSPFWAVQNLVLQFTFFYFNLLPSLWSTFFHFYLLFTYGTTASYFYLLLFTWRCIPTQIFSEYIYIYIHMYIAFKAQYLILSHNTCFRFRRNWWNLCHKSWNEMKR